jgi:hypothetical protein
VVVVMLIAVVAAATPPAGRNDRYSTFRHACCSRERQLGVPKIWSRDLVLDPADSFGIDRSQGRSEEGSGVVWA